MPKKKPAAKKQTKTAFVLSFPHSMPAKDVVAKGKAAGVSLSDKHVWAIRSDAKKRKSKGAAKKSSRKQISTRATPNAHGVSEGDVELLRNLAARIGVPRVLAVLEAERERALRILGR